MAAGKKTAGKTSEDDATADKTIRGESTKEYDTDIL